MSRYTLRQCPTCMHSCVVSFGTDGRGNLVESREPCLCERGLWPPPRPETEEARRTRLRRAGRCVDCEQPVEGVVGKALRCALHKRTARNAANGQYRKRNRPKIRRRERKYCRRSDVKARRLGRKRELHNARMKSDPQYAAEYRLRRQREHLLNHPGRAKYMATQRRHNANPERQERKRSLALEAYYRAHPERPAPTCATCSERIEWSPPGRPPKYHQTPACNPHWATSRHARGLRAGSRTASAHAEVG